MDHDTNYVKVLLTDEELGLPAIDELFEKFSEWVTISKESKTRAANRRADMLYDELMSFTLPSIKINPKSSPVRSVDTSVSSEDLSNSSRPITRSLRSRSRTPTTTPCTPTHQKIRSNLKQATSGSSVVASAAKARHQLRADSAQKKREEEKERNERLMLDRKVKETRAEAQKKQILEERAINAKLKREQRLLHAAEVRKAREEAKQKQKQKLQEQLRELQSENVPPAKAPPPQKASKKESHNYQPVQEKQAQPTQQEQPQANETFSIKKPTEEVNNIDIVICDDSNAEHKEKVPVVAAWARAPYLRHALVTQFTKPHSETLRKEVLGKIIKPAKLPVDLDQILGPNNAGGGRHLVRTSSAVWSPPNRSLKRSSSTVMTPTNDGVKR